MIFPYLFEGAARAVPNFVDEDVVKHDRAILVNDRNGVIHNF